MSLLVKICGVTTAEALDAAVEAGADAVGFVFHGPSPRHLEAGQAAALAPRLPQSVQSVAVTRQVSQADVDRVLDTFRPDAWQSDADDLGRVRLPEGIERWPVFRSAGAAGALPRRIVFDGPLSGQGLCADWRCAAALALRCELLLAGGLDASNVALAIATVRPFGVDVATGVESAPGVKDAARIRAFVTAARRAAEALAA